MEKVKIELTEKTARWLKANMEHVKRHLDEAKPYTVETEYTRYEYQNVCDVLEALREKEK